MYYFSNMIRLTKLFLKRFTLIIAAACAGIMMFSHADCKAQQKGNLEITISDIRSQDGIIGLGLSISAEQWPYEPKFEYGWKKAALKEGRMTVTIEDLDYGTYAFAVLDDENSNHEMDYTLGLPREGWAMSNNPEYLKLSPPAFEDCVFELNVPVLRLEVEMNYIRKRKGSGK